MRGIHWIWALSVAVSPHHDDAKQEGYSLGVDQETSTSDSGSTPTTTIRPTTHIRFFYTVVSPARAQRPTGGLPSSQTQTVPGVIIARS